MTVYFLFTIRNLWIVFLSHCINIFGVKATNDIALLSCFCFTKLFVIFRIIRIYSFCKLC